MEILKALIGYGANVNEVCGKGSTNFTIGIAAQNGKIEVIRTLLQAGAHLNSDHCRHDPLTMPLEAVMWKR